MNPNEKQFYDFWLKNLFRKTSAPISVVQEAYYLLNQKNLITSCSNCLSKYSQEMKNVFNRLHLEKENGDKEAMRIALIDSGKSNEEFIKEVMRQERMKQQEKDFEEFQKLKLEKEKPKVKKEIIMIDSVNPNEEFMKEVTRQEKLKQEKKPKAKGGIPSKK